MASDLETVTVSILGREYQINCPPAEEEALRKSARYLDQQIGKIKARGSTLGFEKLAVMAALNISNDLLKQSQQASSTEGDSLKEIKRLEAKIDSALLLGKQLEIQ
ncbi:MAG: cell division protein ZapA [Pseudomonadales bacterium]|nr:cell division protein ZapA [Pseudomonadales bacterium]